MAQLESDRNNKKDSKAEEPSALAADAIAPPPGVTAPLNNAPDTKNTTSLESSKPQSTTDSAPDTYNSSLREQEFHASQKWADELLKPNKKRDEEIAAIQSQVQAAAEPNRMDVKSAIEKRSSLLRTANPQEQEAIINKLLDPANLTKADKNIGIVGGDKVKILEASPVVGKGKVADIVSASGSDKFAASKNLEPGELLKPTPAKLDQSILKTDLVGKPVIGSPEAGFKPQPAKTEIVKSELTGKPTFSNIADSISMDAQGSKQIGKVSPQQKPGSEFVPQDIVSTPAIASDNSFKTLAKNYDGKVKAIEPFSDGNVSISRGSKPELNVQTNVLKNDGAYGRPENFASGGSVDLSTFKAGSLPGKNISDSDFSAKAAKLSAVGSEINRSDLDGRSQVKALSFDASNMHLSNLPNDIGSGKNNIVFPKQIDASTPMYKDPHAREGLAKAISRSDLNAGGSIGEVAKMPSQGMTPKFDKVDWKQTPDLSRNERIDGASIKQAEAGSLKNILNSGAATNSEIQSIDRSGINKIGMGTAFDPSIGKIIQDKKFDSVDPKVFDKAGLSSGSIGNPASDTLLKGMKSEIGRSEQSLLGNGIHKIVSADGGIKSTPNPFVGNQDGKINQVLSKADLSDRQINGSPGGLKAGALQELNTQLGRNPNAAEIGSMKAGALDSRPLPGDNAGRIPANAGGPLDSVNRLPANAPSEISGKSAQVAAALDNKVGAMPADGASRPAQTATPSDAGNRTAPSATPAEVANRPAPAATPVEVSSKPAAPVDSGMKPAAPVESAVKTTPGATAPGTKSPEVPGSSSTTDGGTLKRQGPPESQNAVKAPVEVPARPGTTTLTAPGKENVIAKTAPEIIAPKPVDSTAGKNPASVKLAPALDPVAAFEQSTQRIRQLSESRIGQQATSKNPFEVKTSFDSQLSGRIVRDFNSESGVTRFTESGKSASRFDVDPRSTDSRNGLADAAKGSNGTGRGTAFNPAAEGTTGRRVPENLSPGGKDAQLTSFEPQGKANVVRIDQNGREFQGKVDTGVAGNGVGRVPLSGSVRVTDFQPGRDNGQAPLATGADIRTAGDIARIPGMRGFNQIGDGRIAPQGDVRAPHGENRYITGLELALILSIAGIAKMRGDRGTAARMEGRNWSITRENGKALIFVDGRQKPFQVQKTFGKVDGSFRIMVSASGDQAVKLSTRTMRTAEIASKSQTTDAAKGQLNLGLLGKLTYLNTLGKNGPTNFYGQFKSSSYTGGMGLAFVMAASGMTRGSMMPNDIQGGDKLNTNLSGPADRTKNFQSQDSLITQFGRFSLDAKTAGTKRDVDGQNEESDDSSTSALDDYQDFLARLDGFSKKDEDEDEDEAAIVNRAIRFGTEELYDEASQEGEEVVGEVDEDDTKNGALSKVLRRPKWVIEAGQTLDGIAERLFGNADVGWLIADLNRNLLRETYIDNKRIVELHSRQEIELPVYQDIQKFTKAKKKTWNAENLVTIVMERQIDREVVESALRKVVGA
jgi:hypothetical protein